MYKNKITKIKQIAKSYFKNPMAGHDWFHTERIYNLAVKIGKAEKADMSIVKPAVLLHDIARKKEDKNKVECHAQEGAKMARKILKNLNFPEKKIEKIIYAIKVHRYRQQIKPKTLEAQILQDADRLDAVGAIGVGKVFLISGEHHQGMYNPKKPIKTHYDGSVTTAINHFKEKILKLKPKTFNTKTGRQLAKERYKYNKDFVTRFLLEWQGKL